MGEHLVAKPDQLRALIAQRLEDRPDLGDRGVRLVEVEEAGHRGDSSPVPIGEPPAPRRTEAAVDCANHRPRTSGPSPAGPETQMRIAERMSNIGTETAFEVSARARALQAQGRDIIHLQIGEPD